LGRRIAQLLEHIAQIEMISIDVSLERRINPSLNLILPDARQSTIIM